MAPKSKTGTALAVRPPTKRESTREPEAERLPEPETLIVPAALLLAAESTSLRGSEERLDLCGVYLEATGGVGRAVACDQERVFVGSFKIEAKTPSWLKAGIILANDGLKARVAMIAKGQEVAAVKITAVKGMPSAELSDLSGFMVFKVAVIESPYMDYMQFLPANVFASVDEETGEGAGNREWQPIGYNSKHLKHAGEVAKILDTGLPKSERSKEGMVIRAFNSGQGRKDPSVFDFSAYPGALLAICPPRMTPKVFSKETAAILAPNLKLTIAALRAHETRNIAWAANATTEIERGAFLQKAATFAARVAAILQTAPSLPALAAPEPKPDPASEADNWEQDQADAVRHSADPEEGQGEFADLDAA